MCLVQFSSLTTFGNPKSSIDSAILLLHNGCFLLFLSLSTLHRLGTPVLWLLVLHLSPLLMFSSMVDKCSLSTPMGVVLTLDENKRCIRITQATKSAFISYIAQTGNASACLSHSSGP